MGLISYYNGNIYESICVGHLYIEQWVRAHKEPKPATIEIMDKIRIAAAEGNVELKQKLKEKLFYITPAVHIQKGLKRQYSNIHEFNGLMQLDFDKLGSVAEATDLRDYLFETYDPIITSYLSPSKLGVKCIMKIPIVESVDEYKDYHKGAEDEFKEVSSKFDHCTINCVLPLFLSIDPDIKFRLFNEPWTTKGDRTVEYVKLNTQESEAGRAMPDWEKGLATISLFKKKIDEIIDSDGHPRLRAACLVLGSRAGAGYIDLQQADEIASFMVQTNPYLAKKKSLYTKTAYWSIREGYNNPKYY